MTLSHPHAAGRRSGLTLRGEVKEAPDDGNSALSKTTPPARTYDVLFKGIYATYTAASPFLPRRPRLDRNGIPSDVAFDGPYGP